MKLAGTLALAVLAATCGVASAAQDGGAFASFPGRWTGEGRLGFKDGKTETVSCRATYFVGEETGELKQTIRCASPSGKIEVKSNVVEKDGELTGTWNELIYDMSGELTGKVTKSGFVVRVKGEKLSATMDILVKDTKQIVEIHFESSTLLGLTLLLGKSTAERTSDSQY